MAAHDRKWHITQDRTDREKRRKWKRSGRERHEKSEKSEKKERVRPEERWSLSRWLCGGRCCEVSTAADKERIEEERRQKERKEERRAKRREEKQKQRERDEWRRQHNDRGREDIGQAKSNTEADHTANRLRLRSSSRLLDDESDGSGSARSGYSGISRASSFASSCASGTSERHSERERAPGRRRSEVKESRRSRREDPIPSPSTVKVLNLADLRGQDPKVFQTLQAADAPVLSNAVMGANARGPVTEAPPMPIPEKVIKPKEETLEAPLSARSGRSEGAASVQSFRSMASTTVQRYSEHLSGPKKSSAEMKQLVKEFVREMVKGKEMNVLRADGSLMSVKCGLTRSLDTLRIKSGSESRQLGLKEVEKVLTGAPEELGDLETPLDEACATLVLSNECISFKFADQERAEVFTLCLNLFIDGLRKKSE